MSETQPSAGGRTPQTTSRRGLSVDELIFAGLLLLSMGGTAIADFSSRAGLNYWLAMVPIFAAASITVGWRRARARGQSVAGLLRGQVLHWATLALAVYLVYMLQQTGRLNRDDAGLVTLLALALTTVLAGVHFDWRLLVLGALLALVAVCTAFVEEFFWMLLVPTLLLGAGMLYWQRRSGEKPDASAAAGDSNPDRTTACPRRRA
jgi:hypothetical protein